MFYVLCDDDGRHEGMTKTQIIEMIQSALENGYVTNVDEAVFSRIKELCAGSTKQLWVGTEAQFNALNPKPTTTVSAVRIGTNGMLYLCTDDATIGAAYNHASRIDNPHGVTAEQIGAAKSEHTHSLASLNIIYSATEPPVVNGGIWIQPQE